MTTGARSGWREVEQWLRASIAEAEQLLPQLLELPVSMLRAALENRPELRTPGMLHCLITAAHDRLERFPRHAYELTSIAVQYAAAANATAPQTFVARRLEAQAWLEHARAVRALGDVAAAAQAVATARELFEQTPAHAWHLATVDAFESHLLHDLGHHDDALKLVRRAAAQFALHADDDRYLQARMSEVWMLWTAGHHDAATRIWSEIADETARRGDAVLLAHLHRKIGVFELRHGSAEEAARLLAPALKTFIEHGKTADAARVRWNLAEAAAARGRVHEAISEFYKVHAELLATGNITDAAIAATEILDLLHTARRDEEAARLAETLVFTLRDAAMPLRALEAFTWLRAHTLSHESIAAVRRYLEARAETPFVPPDGA